MNANINIVPSTYSFTGKTVLIADDDNLAVRLMHNYFEGTGANLISVNNGLKAVQALDHQSIDLILMDIYMPLMDGYDATEYIRMNNKDIPIIMYTATGHREDRFNFAELGFTDRILKPAYKEDVLKTVAKYI